MIGDNIKNLRRARGLRQSDMADKLDVSSKTISSWEVNRTEPNMGMIEKLAEILNCSKADLIGDDGVQSKRPQLPAARIPVLGRVAAGIPINAVEETIDWEEIPAEMAATGEYFGLRIRGDSMSPRIMDGDTVIVRRQSDAETDDIVIALVNGNDGVCKKLKKTASGIMLISLNPAYEPMVFDHADIDSIPVSIIGRVVELRGKL